VRMIVSALRVFADDVAEHRRGRPCSGLRAPALLPFPSTTAT
jgi:hypothetical protein